MPLRRFLLAAIAGFLALPAAAQSTDPSFNLVNRSGQAIVYAYASPSSDNSWRADRLGRDVLPDGMSYAIRLPRGECLYDIRVEYQDRRVEERRNVNTCQIVDVVFSQGGGQPGGGQAAGPQGNPSFNLVNSSGSTIRELYASPATDSQWGQDRLGRDMVPSGRHYPVRLPQGDCIYDLRAVFDNGQAQERRRINLCEVVNLSFP
jgi:hypothetical protein